VPSPPEPAEETVELWMVEQPPTVTRRVLPDYPDSARAALAEGRVYVRLLVGADGRVVRIGRIAGPGVFHAAAAAAARQWEFVPAIQNDRPVRVWVDVPFRFELEDR
jgi:protein TonB